ncbi:MAG: hypothetical protein IPL87_01920 [Candidatus Moraniibacteriota bacterium]|nr:MAG: hypothetical protein IPL87_01920 [Candidatus Moranbacteria bacterium]
MLDHLAEATPAGTFRCFVVLKLSDDVYPVRFGEVREQSPLGGYGISPPIFVLLKRREDRRQLSS